MYSNAFKYAQYMYVIKYVIKYHSNNPNICTNMVKYSQCHLIYLLNYTIFLKLICKSYQIDIVS